MTEEEQKAIETIKKYLNFNEICRHKKLQRGYRNSFKFNTKTTEENRRFRRILQNSKRNFNI